LYSFLPLYSQEIDLSICEIKGESDHIHFLLETKPTDILSSIVGTLKCKSTSFLYSKGHKFPYWGKLSKTLWSSGYFVCSTGGVSIEVLEKYIRNQSGF
jgi:putative transposase